MAGTDQDRDAAAWRAVRAARHGATVPAALVHHPLCDALLPVATARSIVVAQLGQSLDGRIATVTGASHFINGPGGVEHLHRLRALLDAVLVGVGTVLADDCRLTVRRVEGASPARVVLDPAGRAPDDARIFDDDGARRLVIRAEGARRSQVPGVETVHLPVTAGQIAPADVVAALGRRGLHRVLIEGGADTVSRFVSADAVDRLHMMIAPLIVGSGRPGLALAPVAELVQARRPRTRSFPLPGGDVLFDCDMRREAQSLRHEDQASNKETSDERGERSRGGLFAGR